MGYHVRIVSKNNGFTRSDFDEIKAKLTTQYGFRERLTDTGELDVENNRVVYTTG